MPSSHRRASLLFQAVVVAVISFAAALGLAASGALPAATSFASTALQGLALDDVGCSLGISGRIKGNVSYSGGERIYHVPGQFHYEETIIDRFRGERWFCTEEDARAAGWRRAGY